MKNFLLYGFVLSFLLLNSQMPAHAQGSSEVEAKFVAMLKNATLKGSWAPVQQEQLGASRKDDGYRIAKVEKKEGDK